MKKILAMFLALLMLAVPTLSLADGDFISEAVENGRKVERTTSFELEATGDETIDQLIGELMKALTVFTYEQKDQSGLRLNMNGKDILTVDVANVGEDVYLYSDLLAGQTVVLGQKDVQGFTDNLFDTLVAEGAMTKEEAANAKEQMASALSGASNPAADVDVEAIFSNFDFSALEQFGEDFASRIEEADPSTLAMAEEIGATKAYTFSMNAEDIVKVYDIIFDELKANKEFLALMDTATVSVEGQEMSAEDAVNEMQNTIRTQMPETLKGEIPVYIYLNDADELVAANMEMTMTATVNDNTEPEDVTVKADYTRMPAGEQAMHQVIFGMVNAEGNVLGAATLLYTEAEGYVDAMLTVQADGETMIFAFQKVETATETERTVDALVAVSYGMNENSDASSASTVMVNYHADGKKNGQDAEQTTKIVLSLNNNPLASMTTQSQTTDPVASIVSEDAIRLGAIEQSEFQSWLEAVIGNLQVWAITALQALPSSVLSMFIGQ